MRGANKLLLSIDGRPAIARVCSVALESGLSPVVVVLGHQAPEVRKALMDGVGARGEGLRLVFNPDYRKGRLSSVARGLAELPASSRAAMFLRGDQPWLGRDLVERLIDTFRKSDASVAYPVYRGSKGSPTIFARRHFQRLLALEGDSGTLDLIETLGAGAAVVEVDDRRCLMGIDTPEDLGELLRDSGRAGREGENSG